MPSAQEVIMEDIVEWTNEKTRSGALVRPWVTQVDHPLYADARRIFDGVIQEHGSNPNISHFDMMAMVDEGVVQVAKERMSPKPTPTPQMKLNAMLSGLDTPQANMAKPSDYGLSEVQKRVARSMFYDCKTPLKDYADALGLVKG
jgi:hypothetical protein